jgi:hypothetical protein
VSPSSPATTAAPVQAGTRPWMVVLLWLALVAIASVNHPSWALHRGALFLHLGALVAGFGAVLIVDLHGVLWLIGRRRLGELVQMSTALQPLIWGGLLVLVVSGMFLEPNLRLPRTDIKLVLVLVATLNGLWAHGLSHRLKAHPADASAGAVDQGLLLKVMAAGAISQAAWWGATVIGFLATTSR